ncbi:DUF6046 domain-containing protein [Flavobacterium sp. N2820]|uniref:DUF6046 domain-containing protein n=1 Tax=Flavobacterium sp. N2820 TaxID=2986834 RepID=UPI002224AEA6|nr:DUF6046 domain-containing protein [Flavobacterium sp. N2820]
MGNVLDSRDILFASLMGSQAVALIQRSNLLQNELSKRVLPPIPFLPLKNETQIEKASDFSFENNWQTNDSTPEGSQFFPMSFSFTEGGQKWLFPFEPMINISSGNNIIKRNVAKQGEKLIGTIKERWSRKDFDIQVTGVLMGSMLKGLPEDTFPREQMERLFEFLKHSKEFFIYCHPLEILGITKVVVEDYSFPFTKGENVQAYDLKLTSDFAYNLLIKEEF